ncbi:hypothetical protein F5884DRAFT_747029 [Xylogone sp. PMI_703]|nr:hypothetical protein F5884DRAFT_747029 [Xylogone sp. PMI_703]
MGPKPFRPLPSKEKPWWATSHFNFKLTERPKYVPGSGPPLAPISLLLPHDKEGMILDLVNVSGSPRYLVGYKRGHSQVGVKPQNILDWVSSRTLEDWEFQQTNLREKQRLEEELPIIEAKEARRLQKLEKLAAKKLEKSRVKTEKTPRSRKRKHVLHTREDGFSLRRPSVPGMGMLPQDPSPPAKRYRTAEDISVTSPRRRSEYEGQPSLSMPVPAVVEPIAIDTGSEEDEALAQQLQDTISTSASPFVHMLHPISISSSPEPLQALSAIYPKSSSMSTSRSDDAFYEPSLSKPMSLAMPPIAGNSFSNGPASSNEVASQDEENEDEFDIKGILNDEWRRAKDGTIERYFFIDWEGDWEPTWEPEANVGIQAIEEYEEMLKKRLDGQGWMINEKG